MNGFEQIKAFYSWVFNNPDKIRPTHISLYLFLLNQNNRSMWVEWFKCPYDLAMQGACIGNKNTYYKCLDDLKNFGLIEYKKGINNYKAPLIKLIQMYDSVPLTEQVTVPLSEPQTVPQPEPLSVLLNKNIYKLITDNYKTINDKQKEFSNLVLKLKNSDIEEVLNIPENFSKIWQTWIDYRKANKIKNYASQKYEQMAFDKLIAYSDGTPQTAEKIIMQSITNSWKGFFELKETKPQKNEQPRTFNKNR